jgi:hypothetical protein
LEVEPRNGLSVVGVASAACSSVELVGAKADGPRKGLEDSSAGSEGVSAPPVGLNGFGAAAKIEEAGAPAEANGDDIVAEVEEELKGQEAEGFLAVEDAAKGAGFGGGGR